MFDHGLCEKRECSMMVDKGGYEKKMCNADPKYMEQGQ